ncbi:NAD(P)/FAD-dependent oxidoreductase [Nocardia sp. NPDC052566]|uniref:NAD(P)/FAD-dependent oxidoreductase n=1 Tax=Nocardia sp. NPDC052566 TaxID=3364330 RepID=UPI0037CAF930
MNVNREFDVLILGSGLSGSTLALILQAAGLRTCLIDRARHPRFAIGESTIPNTSKTYKLMSIKYGVPELAALSSFGSLIDKVGTTNGMKDNFGFVYHEADGAPAMRAHQFPLSQIVETESHLFRADVDHWLALRAVDYGAQLLEGIGILDIDIDDDRGVTVECDNGARYSAQYVVDASGRGSPLARKLGLRTTDLRTRSKSVFTHMTDVAPFDGITSITAPKRWHTGTLHHVFPNGWMWVIPFDNHPGSSSPLCSVGVCWRIDDGDDAPFADPAHAFADFLTTYPEIGKQFQDARRVMDWVSAGRLQYNARKTTGDRWCLTSNAAGFIDPLFSRGMQNTAAVTDRLAEALINQFHGGFTPKTFDGIDALQDQLIRENDYLVANAYSSFADYDLWNAWFRVWQVNQVTGTMRTEHRLRQVSGACGGPTAAGVEAPIDGFIDAFYSKADEIMNDYRAGGSTEAAAAEFRKLFAGVDFMPPSFGLTDLSQPYFDIDMAKVASAVEWAQRARPGIRELFLGGLPADLRAADR